MKKLIPLVVFFVLVGCNTPCSDSTIVVPAAQYLTTMWNCKDAAGNPNLAGMQAWLAGIASSIGVCSQTAAVLAKNDAAGLKTGPVGMIACPILIDAVRSEAAKIVPTSIGCDPSKIFSNVATGTAAICAAIVPM